MHTMKLLRLSGLFFGLFFLSNIAVAQIGNNGGVLNPNLADTDELGALPGMSAELAERIIAARPLASNTALNTLFGNSLGDDEKSQLRAVLFLPVNLNSADNAEVMLVPAINEKMAHEFEEYKPYASLEQFRREIGKYLDAEEVARYEQYVFVPMNLNSASAEDLSTIPGMSNRMVHEFEEYRPYTSIEQFRREIGKYVDVAEVARLERYVFVE